MPRNPGLEDTIPLGLKIGLRGPFDTSLEHCPVRVWPVAQTALSAVSPTASRRGVAWHGTPGIGTKRPSAAHPTQVGNLRNSRLGSLRYYRQKKALNRYGRPRPMPLGFQITKPFFVLGSPSFRRHV